MNPTNSQFQLSDSENHLPSFISTSYNSQGNDIQIPQNQNQPVQPVHPNVFYYRPSNDFCHYYVKCKEISYETIVCLLGRNIQSNDNELIFFYLQQHNNRFYQVTCEIVSQLLINNCLNKNFLGIELQEDVGQENLVFTAYQKENLEYHLKQRLSQYLLN